MGARVIDYTLTSPNENSVQDMVRVKEWKPQEFEKTGDGLQNFVDVLQWIPCCVLIYDCCDLDLGCCPSRQGATRTTVTYGNPARYGP